MFYSDNSVLITCFYYVVRKLVRLKWLQNPEKISLVEKKRKRKYLFIVMTNTANYREINPNRKKNLIVVYKSDNVLNCLFWIMEIFVIFLSYWLDGLFAPSSNITEKDDCHCQHQYPTWIFTSIINTFTFTLSHRHYPEFIEIISGSMTHLPSSR